MAEKKAATPEKVEKKKGGKLKLIIIALVVLGVLGGGGFAAWKFFLQPKTAGETAENATAEGAEEHKAEAEQGGQLVTLDSFVVNLSDPMGRRYLKTTLDVEVANAAVAAELTAAMPKVKDTLLLLLSSKSFADISSMDKKIELKNDIVSRLNQIIGKNKVRNVYFTEFVVQ
ncbi:flagellar FliL protein [Desulfomicrobium macestii]|uniref:Flagellar protein FliL n=2 Tax=Desulfomicrobium TaxID=898 RepID=A0A8G2C1V5_DESNO|nr:MULTISPECIES: flagellar basal body-associated FliL family protein [Desulfomicrobium]MBE1425158.1 flagellar FliL protein [Desulfomicrobium macestii]SFL55595.1 flagellar FliL protein [Desulfomicrobium norvegicum]